MFFCGVSFASAQTAPELGTADTFAVLAGSTKEIRELIQEVRAAVNASVMTTETASKTVEAGATHFSRVSTSFRDISHLVRTTNEAAREIELSTKQQTSAVEQVNRGVADVAQAAKETEVTSAQMLETVSQLATLSLDLSRLVRSQLYGIEPSDPLTLVVAAAMLATVGLLAGIGAALDRQWSLFSTSGLETGAYTLLLLAGEEGPGLAAIARDLRSAIASGGWS